MRSGVWSSRLANAFAKVSAVEDFALAPAERALFEALTRRGVRFRSIEREVGGVVLRILPLDRVIASKRATHRAKDLAQLPALEATLLARSERPPSRES